ncbi:hypothetical protein ACFMPD_09190 [Sedimentitalea sp. HM32M-2]|uniref:hypothetical protein n=1 Tax=Sedimentitalea sp. HM32M-2 TaxID=3351566 RepID=UPI00363A9409
MTYRFRLAALVLFASTLAVSAEETGPVTAVISHPVADYETWRKTYDAWAPMREAAGMTSARVLHGPDDPNMIVLVHEFASLDQARALFESAELKVAMKDAGVLAPPTITFGIPAD